MPATLTDDADRMPFGCDAFDSCPVGERDILSDEWESACGRPTCGGAALDGGENVGCPGCRHCEPPDREAKPYGWGIEGFEDPALSRANAEANAERSKWEPKYTSAWVETWGMAGGHWPHHDANPWSDWKEYRDFLWRHYSRQSARRERHGRLVWDRLCDECETHTEAVGRYSRWAARAITVRYRDEAKPCSELPPTLRPASPTGSTPSPLRRGERSPTAS